MHAIRDEGQNGRSLATYSLSTSNSYCACIDSAGPIGRAQAGIDFHRRMGDGWAYLEVSTPNLQSSEKEDCSACPSQWGFRWFQLRPRRKATMSFWDPGFLVCVILAQNSGYEIITMRSSIWRRAQVSTTVPFDTPTADLLLTRIAPANQGRQCM